MRRIVKVGGSLLKRVDLVPALTRWIDQQTPAETFLVVGGGELIDAIRHLDRLRPADSIRVHWRCVDLLQVTFEMFAECFEQWPRIDSASELAKAIESEPIVDRPTVVSIRSFYRPECGWELPSGWGTTSDSIAAVLAIQTCADELVLLKSCPVDGWADLREAATQGIVDPVLPTLMSQLNSIRLDKLPD